MQAYDFYLTLSSGTSYWKSDFYKTRKWPSGYR